MHSTSVFQKIKTRKAKSVKLPESTVNLSLREKPVTTMFMRSGQEQQSMIHVRTNLCPSSKSQPSKLTIRRVRNHLRAIGATKTWVNRKIGLSVLISLKLLTYRRARRESIATSLKSVVNGGLWWAMAP